MLNNRELAEIVARSVRTIGGYLYAGTRVNGTVYGLAQEVWSCKGPNFHPGPGDVNKNEELLASAPVGAEVGLESREQNAAFGETWQKGQNGKWSQTASWEERWGYWGRSEENRLTGELWEFES